MITDAGSIFNTVATSGVLSLYDKSTSIIFAIVSLCNEPPTSKDIPFRLTDERSILQNKVFRFKERSVSNSKAILFANNSPSCQKRIFLQEVFILKSAISSDKNAFRSRLRLSIRLYICVLRSSKINDTSLNLTRLIFILLLKPEETVSAFCCTAEVSARIIFQFGFPTLSINA